MNATFGEYIKKLRTGKGLTLTQLAAQIKLDSANLSKIENGKREFNEKRIELLCQVFQLERKEVEKELMSEKVAIKLYSYQYSDEILALAESKIKYLRSKKSEQGNLNFNK